MRRVAQWLVGVVLWATAGAVSAAELEILDAESHPICDAHLSGVIEKGDAERLNLRFLQDKELCLNSPGGSMLEGIAMFNLFRAKGISTRVLNEERCVSACALAFLGGTNRVKRDTGDIFLTPSRRLSARADLGFHAPGITLSDDQTYDARQVTQAFNLALKAMEAIYQLRRETFASVAKQDGKEPMADFLYRTILGTPFDEMTYVDTVAKALASGIEISDIAIIPEKDYDEMAAERICSAAYVKQWIESSSTQTDPLHSFRLLEEQRRALWKKASARKVGASEFNDTDRANSSLDANRVPFERVKRAERQDMPDYITYHVRLYPDEDGLSEYEFICRLEIEEGLLDNWGEPWDPYWPNLPLQVSFTLVKLDDSPNFVDASEPTRSSTFVTISPLAGWPVETRLRDVAREYPATQE